jgi:hypothetical protein
VCGVTGGVSMGRLVVPKDGLSDLIPGFALISRPSHNIHESPATESVAGCLRQECLCRAVGQLGYGRVLTSNSCGA